MFNIITMSNSTTIYENKEAENNLKPEPLMRKQGGGTA